MLKLSTVDLIGLFWFLLCMNTIHHIPAVKSLVRVAEKQEKSREIFSFQIIALAHIVFIANEANSCVFWTVIWQKICCNLGVEWLGYYSIGVGWVTSEWFCSLVLKSSQSHYSNIPDCDCAFTPAIVSFSLLPTVCQQISLSLK